MQKFVDKIAVHLLESEIHLQDWIVILPSERAKQYIQNALFEKTQKPFFAPTITTINHWVSKQASKSIIDKTHLLLELFEIHRQFPSTEIDSTFDEFLTWGRMLMSDFDEIERYLVDSSLLFRNLKDIKEIENWSFNSTEELTENQKKYLDFWDRLGAYFTQLQINLSKKESVMLGSVYRNLAENTAILIERNKGKRFLFAGFNALSLAEMHLFKNLTDAKMADVIFNADAYYLNDKYHEAGYFIRKYNTFSQAKNSDFIENELSQATKQIELISCSQLTGQVKVAQTILAQIPQNELSETVILLADESLIIPLLQNIPKSVKKANITLGLPLKSTALLTWIELIFSIQEGFLHYNRTSIYHKNLFALWNHPFYFEILNEQEKRKVFEKEKHIRNKNIIFQSLKNVQISEKSDQILNLLFTPWGNSWSVAMTSIRHLNQLIFNGFEDEKSDNKLEKAIIQRFDEVIIDFQNCVNTVFPEMSLRSFRTLFNQEWMSETLAYYGNPTDGLQVMGLLETRLLDFKNLIVLGLNEGKMPPNNTINSLIPMDLRKFVGLPTVRDKQGLFAHHFYRLFHYADKIYITYHNGLDSFSFAEKSRFVSQLEMELVKENKNITLIHKDYTLHKQTGTNSEKRIAKTPEILQQIDSIFARGISPSLIKKYFTCSLDFYFQYVLNFGEEKKVEEELESNSFGSIIHAVLEDLYQKFNQKNGEIKAPNLTEFDIDVMLKSYEKLMFEAFKEHFNGDEAAFKTGKNFLSYTMSLEMCRQFLQSEKLFFQKNPKAIVFIKALEMRVETELEMEIFGELKKVKLKGFIDRVDEVDGKIRILDYKSGKVEGYDVEKLNAKIDQVEIETLMKCSRSLKHFFQLYAYLFMYFKQTGEIVEQTGIISFVTHSKNPYLFALNEFTNKELIEKFPELLQSILTEIYDSETVFEHNSKSNYCGYCLT